MKLLKLILLLLLPLTVLPNAVDSLLALTKNAKERDTNLVNAYNELIYEYSLTGNVDSANYFFAASTKLGRKLNFKRGLAAAHRFCAKAHLDKGNFNTAINYYTTALTIFQTLHDEISSAKVMNSIGSVYRELAHYDEALKYYYAAIKTFGTANDTLNTIITKANCASVLRTLKNYSESEKLYKEALSYFISINYSYTGSIYNNLGNLYSDTKRNAEAIECFKKAIAFNTETGNKIALAQALNNLGLIYEDLKNYDHALECYQKSLAIKEAIQDKNAISITCSNIASVLTRLGKTSEARTFADRAYSLAKETGSWDLLMKAHQALYTVNENRKDYKKAFYHFRLSTAYRDSINNDEVTRETTRHQMQYEFDRKEAENNAAQAKKDAIAQEETKRQRIILWCVAAGLFIVLCFSVLMLRAYRAKRKSNIEIIKQKDIIEEKQKEILDSIYYARKIQQALITSEKYIERKLSALKKN